MSNMLPRPKPRDAFKRALRAQLMVEAPGVLGRRDTTWSRVGIAWGSWLKPVAAFATVALLLVGGAGKAAADSLPGDPAFGLKIATEQLQLALAFDDSSRLQLLSDDADHRLAELSRALTTGSGAAAAASDEYAAAVARFTAAVDALRGKPDASEDKRTLAQDVVDAAHAKHEALLDELAKTAPAEAQEGLDRAKLEADKLHPSDRPAGPLDPANGTDPARTPQPTRTAPPHPSPNRP
jgi:hypothetical protein